MPAVTTVAFDSLLQRDAGHSSSAPNSQHLTLHSRRDARDERPEGGPPRRSSSSSFSYYISSPALYVAPEPAQLAGSSAAMCVSPSPYVVNHKRREWPSAAAAPVAPAPGAECSNGDVQPADREVETGRSGGADAADEEEKGVLGAAGSNGIELAANGGGDCQVEEGEPGEEEVDDFFNPKGPGDGDSETEEGSSFSIRPAHEPNIPLLSQSEFYDASEDFFSDSSSAQPPRLLEMESELRFVRLKLFEEIERRKKAEESLAYMKNEWTKMSFCFSRVGLSFPPIPTGQGIDDEDEVSEVCQEVVISRLVSEAFERDLARAEAEASAAVVIESKNHEISRLCDRLQYYEAVNHEMSQRNQEEKARQRSQKRRSTQRLVWGCIGVSITIGASLLVHSYLSSPGTGGESSEPVNNTFEPSPAASEPTIA